MIGLMGLDVMFWMFFLVEQLNPLGAFRLLESYLGLAGSLKPGV